MKRVLHIVSRMGYGGIETLLMNIYRAINRDEIQFDFAVVFKEKGEYDDEIKKLGGNIYYLPRRSKNIVAYKKGWEQFFKDNANKYNAIHMHVSSLTNVLPIKLAKKYGIKNRFIHSHNTYQKGAIHNILNKIHMINIDKIATKLIACSTEAGRYCFGRKKFEVFKNGIHTSDYKYSLEKRKTMREELKLQDGQTALIHVGRFMEQKNHTFLIDIFNEVLKINENFMLFLIGEGELKEETENKVKSLGIEDKVVFLGKRSDVNDILQAMDIFVLPSLHEGLPVVGIEAQAAGLKCIMSENISKEVKITDLVEFLPIEDAKEWANEIMKEQKYDRKDMQKEIIKHGYDIVEQAKKLEDYYIN